MPTRHALADRISDQIGVIRCNHPPAQPQRPLVIERIKIVFFIGGNEAVVAS